MSGVAVERGRLGLHQFGISPRFPGVLVMIAFAQSVSSEPIQIEIATMPNSLKSNKRHNPGKRASLSHAGCASVS